MAGLSIRRRLLGGLLLQPEVLGLFATNPVVTMRVVYMTAE
jgi:hypothetical protein